MQAFLLKLLIAVISDPKTQQVLKNLLSDLITEKIAPLVPLAAASAAHAFADLMPGVTASVEDVVQVANTVRDDLNRVIPDIDIGIPLIDDILDAWRPKHGWSCRLRHTTVLQTAGRWSTRARLHVGHCPRLPMPSVCRSRTGCNRWRSCGRSPQTSTPSSNLSATRTLRCWTATNSASAASNHLWYGNGSELEHAPLSRSLNAGFDSGEIAAPSDSHPGLLRGHSSSGATTGAARLKIAMHFQLSLARHLRRNRAQQSCRR
jgi:hypothetical protein